MLGSRGGVAVESLDPNLQLNSWRGRRVGRARAAPKVGLRMAVIWRGERQGYMRQNVNRPLDAFTVPVTVGDPGSDGRVGTGDDGLAIHAFDLPFELVSRAPQNVVGNVHRAASHYWALDVAASRRFAGRWSLVAGFEHTWSRQQASGYFGQSVRNNALPLTPNDLVNAGPDGRHEFGTWSAKVHGTFEGPWGVRLTPLLRHQSGQPYGRTFTTTLAYGNVRLLAEPIGTRRMDNVTILDVRLEKGFRMPEAVAWPDSSTCSTCSTPTPSRSRVGHPARSCGRCRLSRPASPGSAPSWTGDGTLRAGGVTQVEGRASFEEPSAEGRRAATRARDGSGTPPRDEH